ncbi:hypothetical protein [Nitrosopumilus cobalaminigenes]|nr:hypothetical protein [Nitrosopumilus cobalaminigenes]
MSEDDKIEKMLQMLKEEKKKLLDEVDETIMKKKSLSDPNSENELLRK